jgi:electron transfer flavoprotein beta subunit
MKMLVLFKEVPDVVEELEVDASGKALDRDAARLILSESDDHALEEALLLKEDLGGEVAVMATDSDEADQVLFTALAKGADRATKLVGDEPRAGSGDLARQLAFAIRPALPDLILTGAQAIDDLDGQVAPMLAQLLGLPFVGVVTAVKPGAAPAGQAPGTVLATKELAGGMRAEFEVALPAVLGVQSAEKPPRYAAVAKVRQMMKTAKLEERDLTAAPGRPQLEILKLYKPEVPERAQMLEGSAEEVAAKVCDLMAEQGLL